jgi:acyl-CoA synthetase
MFPRPDQIRTARYHAAGYWGKRTIPAMIAASAAAHSDKAAVRDASGLSLSYRELDVQAGRLAGYLAAHGVGVGDIVTLCLPNWCQTVVAFLAVMKVGAVVNPVPVTYGRADLAFVLSKCESKALFIPSRFRSTDFIDRVAALPPDLRDCLAVIRIGDGGNADVGVPFEAAAAFEPALPAVKTAADDPVAVLFTSGTESRAKGAVHTHNTILFGELSLARTLGFGAEDVAFMASPISHTTGFMHGVMMTLALGGTLSLLDIFEGAAAARQMAEHEATWTMGATPFLSDIVDALAASGGTLPSLRYFLCGGAPVPEVLVRRAADIGLRVLSIYGSTESPPHTVVHPEDPPENAWSTDGRPLEGIEVRVVSPEGQDVPIGETGEEWSRGPNTFLGYLGEPELTARDLDRDGWYHSGDVARRLADGSIRLSGRIKDIIVRGGQNISAREVEDYLASHPAVAAVAVVGMPHLRLGETSCAVVVTRDGQRLTLEEITDFLVAKGIARFKLPERLEIWPHLPMNPSGKIQKFLIRKSLTEAPEGQSP